MESNIAEVKQTLNDFKQSLEFTQAELIDARSEIDQLKLQSIESKVITEEMKMLSLKNNESIRAEINVLRAKNDELAQRLVSQENYTRRENLIVYGLKPAQNFERNSKARQIENCFHTAFSLFERLGLPPLPLQR